MLLQSYWAIIGTMQIMQWIQIPSEDVSDKTKLRQTTACQLTKVMLIEPKTTETHLRDICLVTASRIFCSFSRVRVCVCLWTLLICWLAFCFDLILFIFQLFKEIFFSFLPICIFCSYFFVCVSSVQLWWHFTFDLRQQHSPMSNQFSKIFLVITDVYYRNWIFIDNDFAKFE